MAQLPIKVVETDNRLEQAQTRSLEELAAHRWHWTLDESNLERVNVTEYARQVARNKKTIYGHAHGFAEWRGGHMAIGLSEAITRAQMSSEKEAVVDAIATAEGQSFNTARLRSEEIRVVRAIAAERAERKGTTVEEELPAVADFRVKASRAGKNQRAAHRARHGFRFIEVEGHLARAKSLLTKALAESEGVNFTDEETELLQSTIANLKALLGLVDLRITGAADIDWDSELAALEGEAS